MSVMKHYCSFWTDGGKRGCCKAHDEAYSGAIPRVDADVALYQCVFNSGRPVQALLMFLAVRCFGWIFYGK